MTTDPVNGGTPRFQVLMTCGVFEPGFRGGGPVRSVAHIIDTVSEQIEVTLVTSDRDLGAVEPYPELSGCWVERNRNRVFYLSTRQPREWLRLWRELRAVPFDLLYLNSPWSPLFSVAPVIAVRLGAIHVASVIIASRGSFSAAALSLKARKKRLFLWWWGPLLNRMAVRWHASTETEAAQIRAVCPWADVVISPDQVTLPPEPLAPVPNNGIPRLCFIGRVAPMKNLDLVLQALRTVSQPVEFDIFGPLEDSGYWSRCRSTIERLPAAVRTRYRGELAPASVRRTFAEYDAFVFPTRGENFGHIIAESLSASCPVICSAETPWNGVLNSGGGCVISDVTADRLGAEIQRVVASAAAERFAARSLAGAAYRSWRSGVVAENILDQSLHVDQMLSRRSIR